MNNGFQITAPADTLQRTLLVYVGVCNAGGQLQATLSDGSAPTYTDTSLRNMGNGTTNAVYTLTYKAASAGQTLTVKWTETAGSTTNITLQAAVLIASGSLTGSVTTPSTPINLTTEGVTDWAHWGFTSASSFDHKSSGGTEISNYTQIGGTAAQQYSNSPTGYTCDSRHSDGERHQQHDGDLYRRRE